MLPAVPLFRDQVPLRQDYYLNGSSTSTEAESLCEENSLAPQAQLYCFSSVANSAVPSAPVTTSLCGTALQSSICTSLHQQRNAAKDEQHRKAFRMEVSLYKPVVSGSSEWCNKCWRHWTIVHDDTFTPPTRGTTPQPKKEPVAWKGEHWFWPPPARERRPSRSHSRKERKQKKQPEHNIPFATSGPTPFATQSNSPFYTASSTAAPAAPWPPKETSTSSTQPAAVTAEWITAAKQSYPDISTMPEAMRQLVHKFDGTAKSIAEKMTITPSTLDEMKDKLKALKFGKFQHRSAWLKHLEEILTTWQDHVKNYQEQQEHFSRLISKATTEIETTR